MAVTFAALALGVAAVLAVFTFPALSGRVVDSAGLLQPQARAALEERLARLEDQSGIQFVVATTPSLQGGDIETFANALFRFWKLGEAKANNGVLLLVAPNERKVRIEVGYGLEGTLTDAVSSVIIQSTVIPRFKAGDFAGGIERGADAVIGALSTDAAEWQARAKRQPAAQSPEDTLFPLIVFILFVFIVLVMLRNARGTGGRMVRRGGQVIFVPGPGSFGGGSWSGGSSGGSWGGGGGFSGGGGSSGGGGASGGW
ncbi:MAG: TPM domain-containing protein [Alsobacter sp.]